MQTSEKAFVLPTILFLLAILSVIFLFACRTVAMQMNFEQRLAKDEQTKRIIQKFFDRIEKNPAQLVSLDCTPGKPVCHFEKENVQIQYTVETFDFDPCAKLAVSDFPGLRYYRVSAKNSGEISPRIYVSEWGVPEKASCHGLIIVQNQSRLSWEIT